MIWFATFGGVSILSILLGYRIATGRQETDDMGIDPYKMLVGSILLIMFLGGVMNGFVW